MKRSEYFLDDAKVIDGVWVNYIADFDLKLARIGNKKYKAYLRELQQPYIEQIRNGTLDEEKEIEIMRKAIARCIILDWRGYNEDDGTLIAYSESEALKMLEDREFMLRVVALSADRVRYQKQLDEGAEKN